MARRVVRAGRPSWPCCSSRGFTPTVWCARVSRLGLESQLTRTAEAGAPPTRQSRPRGPAALDGFGGFP
jgi:hypothetical protein